MASPLQRARCAYHADREASALCRVCRHSFCRECVTDHQGELWCVRCLAAQADDASQRPPGAARLAGHAALAALGVAALLGAATVMLSLPALLLARWVYGR